MGATAHFTTTSIGWINFDAIEGDPALSSWGYGRLEVFVRGNDNHLWHTWHNANQNPGWRGWEDLGPAPRGIQGKPAISSWGEGRVEVFVRGNDNHLWHTWHNAGQGWRGWEDLGGNLGSSPAAVSWGHGRVDVVARGANTPTLWHMWHNAGQGWSGWQNLGLVFAGDPTIASWGQGRLDVFVRGNDNHLWHTWHNANQNPSWRGWEDLGPIRVLRTDIPVASSPSAVSWGDGRVDVAVRGADNRLWLTAFDRAFDTNCGSERSHTYWGECRTDPCWNNQPRNLFGLCDCPPGQYRLLGFTGCTPENSPRPSMSTPTTTPTPTESPFYFKVRPVLAGGSDSCSYHQQFGRNEEDARNRLLIQFGSSERENMESRRYNIETIDQQRYSRNVGNTFCVERR